jgi:Domain of unknown function (DUF5664)
MSGSGVKFDNGKPRLGLIPRSALEAEAIVLGFGADKYGTYNWRNGMDWMRLVDAALRHIYAFADGETYDPESGEHHLAHARCCLGFLIEYENIHPEGDNRWKDDNQSKAQQDCAELTKPVKNYNSDSNGEGDRIQGCLTGCNPIQAK